MTDCFVGRQPIFDRNDEVVAYDLLYRGSSANTVGDVNKTVATARVIISIFVDIGIHNLVGKHAAFLNVTDSFLQERELVPMGSDQVVLALPGDMQATDENLAAIERLRADGFKFSINGYSENLPAAALLEFVDVVSIDVMNTDHEALSRRLDTVGNGITKIAKRVETRHSRNELIELGFDHFQGHFITAPEVVVGKGLPTNRAAVLQLVAKTNDPDTTAEELEQLISMDPALSLRILRFVNSPLSNLVSEVKSIRHAVVMVGSKTIKNWVMLLALSSLSDSVDELIVTAFIRAQFCENLAKEAGHDGEDVYFTVGLFSVMDSLMSTSMQDLLETLPFTSEIKAALTEGAGPQGQAVQCIQKLEHGKPEDCEFGDVPIDRLSDIYLETLLWSAKVSPLMA